MATAQLLTPGPAADIVDLIAEEVGVPSSEIYDASDFAELGVDDLMAMAITSRIREALQLDLPKATLKDYSNIDELQTYIQSITIPKQPPRPSAAQKPQVTFSLDTKPTPAPAPQATAGPLSTLLQGNPKTAKTTIFLLPDGSGSGMAYAKFPRIAKDVCLIGMNSPFLHSAGAAFTTSIEDLAPIWIAEIRSRQPKGPYVLGGWSAGGYYSFEVTKQLQREGETVSKLILIDSPCRLLFEPLPMEVIHYLAANNLMGNWGAKKKTPDWFVDHFHSTIDAVDKYMPTPMTIPASGDMPDVFIIWAGDGVLKDIDAADTGLDLSVRVTRFLLEGKKDFGMHGWDRLLPRATVAINRVPGNHFTMVHPPNVGFISTT